MHYQIDVESLTIESVHSIYHHIKPLLQSHAELVISGQNIKKIDTSGIAMLLTCWQHALEFKVNCHFDLSESVVRAMHSYNLELP